VPGVVALTSAAHRFGVALIWPAHPGRRRGRSGSRRDCSARSSGALLTRQRRINQGGHGCQEMFRGSSSECTGTSDRDHRGDDRRRDSPRRLAVQHRRRRLPSNAGRGQGWPDRVWAIEGCQGIGRHIAHRLLADGEEVVDVPPKLSARARVFATGQGRKTDATDAHAVALVRTRMAGLRPVVADDQLQVLRLLVDRRRSIGEEHTREVSQLHALLIELTPGGAKKDLSAAQAKKLLASVRPATWSARPASASLPSSSPTSNGSTHARRPRTRSSPSWSKRPAPSCSTCTASPLRRCSAAGRDR